MTDIVPRLRHMAKLLGFDLTPLLNEAADEIDRLREQLGILTAGGNYWVEIERLRAALGPLLDAHWPLIETDDHEDQNCKRARAALHIQKGGERP